MQPSARLPLRSSGRPARRRAPCATTKAFAPFGDGADYALLVNGGLEDDLDGFQFTGDAGIANGNESFALHGAADAHSLALGSGSSATFHAGCVPRLYPSVRFVARSTGAAGALRVEVEYREAKGARQRVTVGMLDAAAYGEWAPTPVLTFLDPSQSLRAQARGTFSLILTPVGPASSWQVDDLYVDPFRFR